jgi:hypothetical protein
MAMVAKSNLPEERESHLEALRAALIVGEQSGPSEQVDFDDFLARQRGPNWVLPPS